MLTKHVWSNLKKAAVLEGIHQTKKLGVNQPTMNPQVKGRSWRSSSLAVRIMYRWRSSSFPLIPRHVFHKFADTCCSPWAIEITWSWRYRYMSSFFSLVHGKPSDHKASPYSLMPPSWYLASLSHSGAKISPLFIGVSGLQERNLTRGWLW